MQPLRSTRIFAIGALFAMGATVADAATATISNHDVVAALQIIQRDADAIAAGKYRGKSLQAPAHEIGAKWYQIEPRLARNGDVLVEVRMANAAITAFDTNWKHNGQARKSAKDVSTNVAQLIAAEKQSIKPSPAASSAPSPSPSPSPSPGGSPTAAAPGSRSPGSAPPVQSSTAPSPRGR